MSDINETFNSLFNFENCCLDSEINLENIPKNSTTQQVARTIEDAYVYPTPQPYESAPKAPLVFTKMLDKLLESIYLEFVTNPKIIRLFDAFNYNNGKQMTTQQYDSIIQACILFWRDKNFELFKQDTKLFFNMCITGYTCDKFYVSYKKYVQNNSNIITDVNDPNLGANGYTQWLGGYIGTKTLTDSTGNKSIVFPGDYSIIVRSAMDQGQIYQTHGFQSRTRKLVTTFSGKPGADITFQFIIGELNTTITETTTILKNSNTLVKITESNALGQTKISSTETDKNGNIVNINVDYVNGLTWAIVNNIDFD
jgi:hypothetical protein